MQLLQALLAQFQKSCHLLIYESIRLYKYYTAHNPKFGTPQCGRNLKCGTFFGLAKNTLRVVNSTYNLYKLQIQMCSIGDICIKRNLYGQIIFQF